MRASHLLPAFVLGLALVGLTALAAEKTESTKTKAVDAKKIDELIEKLGSDEFETREKAHKALDEIGEPALAALSKARDSKDLETKKRATTLHDRIDKRVTTARVLATKEVQFTFKDTPLADAVAEIAKKTGYKIKLHDPANKLKDKKVTLDTGKTTFWNALTLFCEKAGLVDGDPNQMNQGVPGGVPGGQPGVGAPPGLGRVPPARVVPPVKIQVLPGKLKIAPKKLEKQQKQEEKSDEKKEEQKGNAAQQQGAIEKPAIRPAQPVKPVQRGVPAIQPAPGGAPGFAPGGGPVMAPPGGVAWNNVEQGEIYLIPGKVDTKADTKTSFRVRAVDMKKVQQFGAKDDKHFFFALEVTAEPRLRWHSLGTTSLDKSKDNNDQTLKSVDPFANVNGGRGFGIALPGGGRGGFAPGFPGTGLSLPYNSNGLSQFATLKFEKGTKETKSFAELAGTISAKVLDEAETMIVADNVMKQEGKTIKGKKGGWIEVKKVTKDKEGNVTLEFEMEMPANVQPETQQNIPIPADLFQTPGGFGGAAPRLVPLPAPIVPPARRGNVAEAKPQKPVAQPAPVVEIVLPGGGVAIGVPYPSVGYAMNGLTLQDEKGKTIYAQIQPNYQKMRNLGFRFDQKKMEYTVKYKAGKGMPAEPTKLVFTGRKINEVNIPFSLKDVEVK